MRVPTVEVSKNQDRDHIDAQSQNLTISTYSSLGGLASLRVKAGHGFAFPVKAGHKFRIIDLHGGQIVDFLAWALTSDLEGSPSQPILADPKLRFSAGNTRWHLAGATPAVGEHLYTNTGERMFTITEDTVKVHDMTFPCCYPELYQKQGLKNHRACASNISEAMTLAKYWPLHGVPTKMDHREVPDPFNIFQNTPFYKLNGALLSSRKGDMIEMVAEMDVICAVSSCPYDLDGFGKPTEIQLDVWI
jgi:uncharacterized protein YcgI (DUF1989 family)